MTNFEMTDTSMLSAHKGEHRLAQAFVAFYLRARRRVMKALADVLSKAPPSDALVG